MTLHVLLDGADGHLVGEDEVCPCRPSFDSVRYRGELRMAFIHSDRAEPAGPETASLPDTGNE
jgi:hypothetical protein